MKIELRATAEADLDFVLALERDPENTPFIGQWSRDEHRDAIARADREHWILLEDAGSPTGYLIAYDLTRADCGVYVKRIVAARKSGGVGRAALRRFAAHAFDDLGAPRVWLNVHRENVRGQRCYRALGFETWDEDAPLAAHDRAAGNTSRESAIAMVLRRDTS
jgi:diamine N-acetyltransferase